MITPNEIKIKATNKYTAYLRSIVEGQSFFPLVIAGNKKLSNDTVQFENELTALINHSKEKSGVGYTIDYQTVKTRKHGLQDIPVAISFQTEQDYLKFLGKEKEVVSYKKNVDKILMSFPILRDWICRYPMKVVENEWESLLKVCEYFQKTPSPHLYIRELPIQIHTKFIERNKGVIRELLDIIIVDHVKTDEKLFECRFNLKHDEPVVRFRILDKAISQHQFSGIDDLCIPISQFEQLTLPVHTVFIVENKTNMLSFPLANSSIVIWGHGFSVDVLKNTEWLRTKRIIYWGDLDAHGFQILSEIRTHFRQVESLLMDRATFDKFFEGDKGPSINVEKNLCLTQDEKELFEFLRNNKYRLEQEKIPFNYALSKLLE